MMRDSQNTSPRSCAKVRRVLISRNDIARRVRQLAAELIAEYEGRELTMVAVLTGAMPFTADLIRLLPMPLRIEPVWVRSYPGTATRNHPATFRLPPPEDMKGRDVLIVDDIFDSGQTMAMLLDAVVAAGARDVKRCALLRKSRPDLPDRGPLEYCGFDIPDEFVVGYGLDYDGYFRNLPDIGVLEIDSMGARKEEAQ